MFQPKNVENEQLFLGECSGGDVYSSRGGSQLNYTEATWVVGSIWIFFTVWTIRWTTQRVYWSYWASFELYLNYTAGVLVIMTLIWTINELFGLFSRCFWTFSGIFLKNCQIFWKNFLKVFHLFLKKMKNFKKERQTIFTTFLNFIKNFHPIWPKNGKFDQLVRYSRTNRFWE